MAAGAGPVAGRSIAGGRLAPVGLLALALTLVTPGHPLGYLTGLPWGPLSLGCAVAVGVGLFAAWPIWHLPFGERSARALRAVALLGLLLVALRVSLWATAPRYGLDAAYYSNHLFNGVPESSTVMPWARQTRLDGSLDFGSDEFPLFFFNDSERFNSNGPDRLDRGRTLTWSAVWTGYLNVAEPAPATIWLTASGPGELALDGKRLLQVDADGRATAQATVELAAGPHPLQVRYSRRRERSGFLKVETDLTGRRRAVEGTLLSPNAYPADLLAQDRPLALAARGADLLWLGLLAGTLGLLIGIRIRAALGLARDGSGGRLARTLVALERPLLALVPLGFFIQAALPRLDRSGKMVFLGGGQDWLTHETLARDIQFNGPLMTLGKPLGQGALYYAQPLYPYYLALLHTLAGEDLYGVTTLQVLGLGVAVVLIYELARRLFGRPTALVTLALLLGVLVPFELAWVARLLISEALYYWVMPAAILALVGLAQSGPGRGRPALAVLAGALLGLACLTRGPTLLYLPPAGWLLWRGLRRAAGPAAAARLLAVVAVCAGLLIGLVPLRNLIVAGKPALTASSGGVNLQKLHRPSRNVRLGVIEDDPLQRAIDVDRPTREVIEYVRQDPVGYFASYLPLAAYTLGVGSALNDLLEERPVPLHPDLLALNALYLLYLVGLGRARGGRLGLGPETGLVHAFVAIHFLTMVVFAPYDYENRLVTPMYPFIAIFGAAALVGLARSAMHGLRRPAARPVESSVR